MEIDISVLTRMRAAVSRCGLYARILLMSCMCGLTAPGFAVDAIALAGSSDAASTKRLLELLARQQSAVVQDRVGISVNVPQRQGERAALMQAGEDALAIRDVSAALQAFESATYITHDLDSETALARTYLQSGQFQRALALGEHMAGAHTGVEGNSVLYIWLLNLVGQSTAAQRLLLVAQARWPSDPVLDHVKQQLHQVSPHASGLLLVPPIRLAPYGDSLGLPKTARVVGSATLMRDGISALVSAALIPQTGSMWLRNGLGQLALTKPEWRLLSHDLALVALDTPLAVTEDQGVVPDDPLLGSRAYTVEYPLSTNSNPAWPVLRVGALGHTLAVTGGGPLFDVAGRLTGVALRDGIENQPRWVSISALERALHASGWMVQPRPFGFVVDVVPRGRDAMYKVYESSLKTSLQVITATSSESM